MMIFKKAIPRRTFLRGVGTALALPLLDGMVPSFASAAESGKSRVRLSIAYVPNGIIMDTWTPQAEGALTELPHTLKPLEAFRDQIAVLSGLDLKCANQLPGEGGGDHARGAAAFLTGVHPVPTQGANMRMGISMDQVAAQHLASQTQLASLELALDDNDLVGTCDVNFSCAYSNTISWRSATTPLPMENKPRLVFERLFGDSDSTDPALRMKRMREDRSILDSVMDGAAKLATGLGPNDRRKLNEWTDAIRDIERRIQVAEEQGDQELPALDRPAGTPATFEEHAKLMFDLQVLAYQADLTRVITFMIGREKNERAYREIGIGDSFHPLTHHQHRPEMVEKVVKINTFHIQNLAYFLEKLRATPDGDGTLLDHVALLYGSGISDGNVHSHDSLPILLAGGAAGQIKGGRHVRYTNNLLLNLHLSLLDMMGVPVEKLGESTGKLGPLSV
jgi:hypothetical protein